MSRSSDGVVDLTVVIVNYNVKEFLTTCLASVLKASEHLTTELYIVDNNSSDGSISFLKERFPDVNYIINEENVGFGKANNQAIRFARGKYTLLLNPDTIVQEDTLEVLINYMDENSSCGACGCKILNPDGTFAPESRRSVPTVSTAIYKAVGLTALFPKSKVFGAYYQGWKDEDKGGEVPVLSGSFMFFRTTCLKDLEGFDERFFMYGEDIDLCYRANKAGWSIHYVPETSILHYKGESTKKNKIAYNRVFNDAIYKFFEKHFTTRYSALFRFLIFWAIRFRAVASFFVNNIRAYRYVISDLLVINVALIVGMVIRSSFDPDGLMTSFQAQYLLLNVVWTPLYLLFAQLYGIIHENKHSIVGSLKSVLFSFLTLVAITFFIRSLAFSRIILLVSFLLSFITIGFLRFRRVNRAKSTRFSRGKISPLRILLVGAGEKTVEVIKQIKGKARWQVEIAGVVAQSDLKSREREEFYEYLIGDISELKSHVTNTESDVALFLLESVTHKELLDSIQLLNDLDAEVKVIPANMNFMLGKADVEYLDEIEPETINLPYFNPVQKGLKRMVDLVVGSLGMLMLLPLSWAAFGAGKQQKISVPIYTGSKKRSIELLNHQSISAKIYNRLKLSFWIVKGDLSLVGSAPGKKKKKQNYSHGYKSGITGYVQINRERISNHYHQEQFDLHYLQNYSVWLDLDILFKALVREESLTKALIEMGREHK